MSGRQMVTLAYFALFSVMTVLVVAAWLMLGVMSEKHTWRYRVFQVATVGISVLVFGVIYYLWFGAGRPVIDDLIRQAG